LTSNWFTIVVVDVVVAAAVVVALTTAIRPTSQQHGVS